MRKLELFTDIDLNNFEHKISYFFAGSGGILHTHRLSMYPSDYNKVSNQVKFTDLINEIDIKEDLRHRIEDDINKYNNDIVDKLAAIKSLQAKIVVNADILEGIKNMKSTKKIFKFIADMD